MVGVFAGSRGSSHGSGLGRSRGLGRGVRRVVGLFKNGCRRAATDGKRSAIDRLVLRTPDFKRQIGVCERCEES